MEGRLEPATPEEIERILRETWGLPVVSVHRNYMPPDVEGLVYRDEWGTVQGLITWHIEGERAEMVSLEAFQMGRHIGGRMLDEAEKALRQRGVKRLMIATTNDNLRALAFYVRRGYRLIAVHLDALDRVRVAKPQVPHTGIDGLPLRDMMELEKEL